MIGENVDALIEPGQNELLPSGQGRSKYTMVGLEVINLLPEHQDPYIFAQELDHVQRVSEPRPIPGEPGVR